jgi:S1-C subfamily serine protease
VDRTVAGPTGGGGWNTPPPPRPRRTLPGAITAILLVVAILVGLGLGHGVWRTNTSSPPSSGASGGAFSPGNGFTNPFGGNGGLNPGSGTGSGSSASGAPSNAKSIAAKAAPSLVDINTALSYQNDEAAGTGIVLTSDGVVLTNNHVIAGATRVSATDVGNGHTYTATVVGYDRAHDIAVLQLQGAHNLTTATIGDSSKVAVGDPVVGLGNAGGLGGTPSSAGGSVTALDQSITATDESDGSNEQLAGLIQVDADIQPGDSGGALVDTQGRVIGVDTAASAGFSFQTSGGQGFAIPINQATTIGDQIQSGRATDTVHIGPTAFLGVLINPGNSNASGASLARAVAGGPAAQAGLTAGDTITSLGGQTVDSPSTLTQLIGRYHPGDRVQVGWTDSSGQSHEATVTLSTGPAQ